MKSEVLPRTFPVRQLRDQWEVLILARGANTWLPTETEEDARIIARGPVLNYQSVKKRRTGREFAAELRELAATLAKYSIGAGSRYFQERADDAEA